MVPLQASIASLSTVLPDDACPTMAKLQIFAERCVISSRMRPKWRPCKLHDMKVSIFTAQRSPSGVQPSQWRSPEEISPAYGQVVASPRTLHYAGKQVKKKPKRPATNGEQRTVNGERQWLGLKKS